MACRHNALTKKRKAVDDDAYSENSESWDKRKRHILDDESNTDDACKEESITLFDEIAKELNALTMQERETILHQLHGVSNDNIIEESEDVIAESLINFQILLEEERIKQSNHLLRLAEKQYPNRIKDEDFRLMFLRANNFDIKAAVDRLLAHLEMQQLLFGEEKVGKKITLNDLTAGDIQALENGHFQILPEKDRAGRLVAFDSIQHRKEADYEPDSLVRK